MPKKRKNGGKCRHNRGSYKSVRCDISGAIVPKDKAVIGYIVRNIVGASGMKDLKDASYYDRYAVPKLFTKSHACISSAVHRKLVRCQPKKDRKRFTDFHLKVKKNRRKQNELIQEQRRKRKSKFLIQQAKMVKQFRKGKNDPRKVSRYLVNNPQYTAIVKS